jgi:hypothetical protein
VDYTCISSVHFMFSCTDFLLYGVKLFRRLNIDDDGPEFRTLKQDITESFDTVPIDY